MKALDRLFEFRENRGLSTQSRATHLRDLRWLIAKMALVQLGGMLVVWHFGPDMVRLAEKALLEACPSPVDWSLINVASAAKAKET